MEDRFTVVKDNKHPTLNKEQNGEWKAPFFFAQLADTQLGMLTLMQKKSKFEWSKELEMMRLAVEHLNRLKPQFAIVCGDLINSFPTDQELQNLQVADFKECLKAVDPSIALLCVCGNHDIGDRPNSATIDLYKKRFGDDYFVFWVGGVRGIVLNTQLYKDSTDCKDNAKIQDAWLTEQLSITPAPYTIVFSHIPPFINDPSEPNGYFNIDTETRADLLDRMHAAGVKAWFCGHYHRNAGGHDRGMDVVITTAVGTTLIPSGVDPLGLEGFTGPDIGPHTSGFRIVKVQRDAVVHKFFTMDSMPTSVDAGADW